MTFSRGHGTKIKPMTFSRGYGTKIKLLVVGL